MKDKILKILLFCLNTEIKQKQYFNDFKMLIEKIAKDDFDYKSSFEININGLKVFLDNNLFLHVLYSGELLYKMPII